MGDSWEDTLEERVSEVFGKRRKGGVGDGCMGSTVGREWGREIGNSGEGFNVCYCSRSGKVGLCIRRNGEMQ